MGESPDRVGEILPCFLMLRGAVLGTVSALLSNAHPFQLLPMKPQAGLLFEPKISPYGATVFFFFRGFSRDCLVGVFFFFF